MGSIVVIDDDPVIRRYLSRWLSRHHTVHTFDSWSAAFRCLSEREHDLVLVDVQLPGFQGDEIVRMLGQKSHRKVVLFSSLDSDELQRRADDCQADGFVQKSSNPHVLRRSLERFISIE